MGLLSKWGTGRSKSSEGTPKILDSQERNSASPVGPDVRERVSPIPLGSVQRSVSVIIPVYNAMPYLTELLNSLEAQDLSSDDFDVIAVDDGSDDFSGQILDVYSARNANFRVIHQENSGWPGKPRNVGIAASESEFVFFCDADDRLGPEALRRMVDYARKTESDVVVPKMVGLGGRRVQASLFTKTIEDVPLRLVLRSLSPQKLVRRSLLLENNIRFHEERVRLEDGIVMSACYLRSRKTSILADYDYYFIRTRTVGSNISSAPIEPAGYVRSLTEIAKNLLQDVPDRELAQLLVLDLFRRKGLRFYEPGRFLAFERDVQLQWIDSHSEFLERFLPEESLASLAPAESELTELIRQRAFEAIVDVQRTAYAVDAPMRAESAVLDGAGVQLQLSSIAPLNSATLVLKNRASTKQVDINIAITNATTKSNANLHTATIGRGDMLVFGKEIVDLWTVVRDSSGKVGTLARVVCPIGTKLPPLTNNVRVYSTAHGSLSIDLRK